MTDSGDSGAGTLRQAILDANASSDDNMIDFDSSLSGQTITLTSGQLTIVNNGSLTVEGGGVITINGNDASRVFDINTGAHVTLDGLTMTHGKASYGGIIQNVNATLTVIDSTISYGRANSTSLPYGGGVYGNFRSTTTIIGSTLSHNVAGYGGAVGTDCPCQQGDPDQQHPDREQGG